MLQRKKKIDWSQRAAKRLAALPFRDQLAWHRRRLAVSAMENDFAVIPRTPSRPRREALWEAVVEQIGADTPLTVLEFGVYKGTSMEFWTSHFRHPDCRFHGFDSFIGLPVDWTPRMPAGTFSTNGEAPSLTDSRLTFHKGWIQNTLPPFLEKSFRPDGKLLVHVDTDIYSAALFVLSAMWWHGPAEQYVVFDEFGIEENVALGNFAEAYPVQIDFHFHTWSQFNLPAQVFATLRRTEYTPPKE